MTTYSGHTDAISASKVIGTAVYNTAGEPIGTIEMSCSTRLRTASCLPSSALVASLGSARNITPFPGRCSTMRKSGGSVVPFSHDQLKAAPAYSIEELTAATAQAARNASYDYYRVDPYWMSSFLQTKARRYPAALSCRSATRRSSVRAGDADPLRRLLLVAGRQERRDDKNQTQNTGQLGHGETPSVSPRALNT